MWKKTPLWSRSVQQEPGEPSGWGCWRQNSSQTFNSFGLKQLCSLQGCQVYSAHISRPCVIRLLTWLWDRARCAGAAWHSFLSLGMIWFSSALPPVRWPKEKLSSFSWQAVLHRSSEWRGVSVSFCTLSKWEWKNRGERRESTLDEKKSLLCVYSVWTVASSACERQTLLVTSVCCVLDIVKNIL